MPFSYSLLTPPNFQHGTSRVTDEKEHHRRQKPCQRMCYNEWTLCRGLERGQRGHLFWVYNVITLISWRLKGCYYCGFLCCYHVFLLRGADLLRWIQRPEDWSYDVCQHLDCLPLRRGEASVKKKTNRLDDMEFNMDKRITLFSNSSDGTQGASRALQSARGPEWWTDGEHTTSCRSWWGGVEVFSVGHKKAANRGP